MIGIGCLRVVDKNILFCARCKGTGFVNGKIRFMFLFKKKKKKNNHHDSQRS